MCILSSGYIYLTASLYLHILSVAISPPRVMAIDIFRVGKNPHVDMCVCVCVCVCGVKKLLVRKV